MIGVWRWTLLLLLHTCTVGLAQEACTGQGCASVLVSTKEGGGVDLPGCGTGSASPCGSIEAAVRRLPLGGTVLLEDGEYSILPPGGIQLGGRNFTVRRRASSGSPGGVVLRCSNGTASGRCFDVSCVGGASNSSCSATAVRIEGVTMTGGALVRGGGGAVSVDGPGLFLFNVNITHSRAPRGGGVSIASSARGAALHDVRFHDCRSFDDPDDVFVNQHGRGGALAVNSSAAPVLVSGGRFSACAANEGGAVSIQSCNLTLRRCEFADSHATHTGGALTIDYAFQASHVVISNCSFRNLRSERFDSNYEIGWGGAVAFQGLTLTIADSDARNCTNTAKGGGFLFGAVSYINTPLPISIAVLRSSFEECSASLHGGAIGLVLPGRLLLEGVRVRSCSTLDTGLGGGVYVAGGGVSVDVRSGEFSGCRASSGGALWGSLDSLNVSDCQFSDNRASMGGALATTGGLVQVAGTHFDRCAASQGGAVMVSASRESPPFVLTLDNCTASANTALQGGAVYTSGSGRLTVRGSNFTDCAASSEGGAVDVLFDSTDVAVSGSLFWGCSSYKGGAVSMGRAYDTSQSYTLQVSRSSFVNNTGSGMDGGGALYLGDGGSDTSVNETLFEDNTAQTSGGGAIATLSRTLDIEGSTFRRNLAFTDGGAILYLDSRGSIARSRFVNNTSWGRGGTLFAAGRTRVAVALSAFLSNYAQEGGVLGAATHASFSRCLFSGNSAEAGGCFSLTDAAALDVARSVADSNAASSAGGTVIAKGDASVSVRATQFLRSRAAEGGVLFASGSATVALKSCLLSLGGAVARGGALLLGDTVTLDMRFCEASNNSAPAGEGGFLHASGVATSRISDTRLVSNSASKGGAVSASSSSVLSLTRVAFLHNAAARLGGALALEGQARLTAMSCTIANNSAGLAGGGIFAVGSAQVQLIGSRLSDNEATASAGGAMCCNSSSLLLAIDGCTFSGNAAASGGGAVYDGAAALGHIRDSLFVGNRALPQTGSGGALEVLTWAPHPAAAPGADAAAAGSKAEAMGADGAEGGPAAAASPLALARLRFANNSAHKGGAIYQGYSGGDSHAFLECVNCSNLGGNRAAQGPFQSSLAVAVRPLLPAAGTSAVYGSSLVQLPPIRAELVDAYGQVVLPFGTTICRIGPEELLSGTLEAVADSNGTFSWTNLAPVAHTEASSSNNSSNSSSRFTVTLSVIGSGYISLRGSFELRFCAAGQFFEERSRACVSCTLGHYCEAAQALQACPPGTFSFRASSKDPAADCRACGTGLTCAGGNISVDAGFWTNVAEVGTLARAYRCRSRGCQGAQLQLPLLPASAGADAQQCAQGYLESRSRLWVVFALLAVLVWAAFLALANVLESINVIVCELQFVSLIGFINLSHFPAWVHHSMQLLNIALFQLDFLGPHCVLGNWSFDRRFAAALAPALAVVAVHLALLAANRLEQAARDALGRTSAAGAVESRRRERLAVGSMVHCLDMLYLPVILRCLEAFQPTRLDRRVLSFDPSVPWGSSEHHKVLPFAVIITAVFGAGLPLFTLGVLHYGRRKGLFHDTRFLDYWWWMFERFEPGCRWWYLVVVTLRRIVFILVTTLLIAQPQIQGIVAFLITLLVICGHCLLKPFREASLNVLGGILLVGQFMYISADLGSAIDVNPETAAGTAGAGLILVLVTIAVFLPYEVAGTWARMWVGRWAARHTKLSPPERPPPGPSVAPGAAASSSSSSSAGAAAVGGGLFDDSIEAGIGSDSHRETKGGELPLAPFAVAAGRAKLPRQRWSSFGRSLLSPSSAPSASMRTRLVPMQMITDWFYPRVACLFLRGAGARELALLHRVRELFSEQGPSAADVAKVRHMFQDFPHFMDYAIVTQLLSPASDDELASKAEGEAEKAAAAVAEREGEREREGEWEGEGERDASFGIGSVSGLALHQGDTMEEQKRKVKQLEGVAALLGREVLRTNDSLRIIITPAKLIQVNAWLIYGSPECKVAFSELVAAVRTRFLDEYYQVQSHQRLDHEDHEPPSHVPPYARLFGKVKLWIVTHFP
eukprot:jgi/Mesen1/8494/ME000480S07850